MMFLDLLLLQMIRTKSNRIYIDHFNVSLLFPFIFYIYVIDCAAFGTSPYNFEEVHFVEFFTLLPICQALFHFMDLTTLFSSSSCRFFTGVADFVLLYLPLPIFSIASKFFNSCKLLMTAAWALCTLPLYAQVNTCSLSIITFSSLLVSSLIISDNISGSFSLCMNCSLTVYLLLYS